MFLKFLKWSRAFIAVLKVKPPKRKANENRTYVPPPWKGTVPSDILERIEILQEGRVIRVLNGNGFLTVGKTTTTIRDRVNSRPGFSRSSKEGRLIVLKNFDKKFTIDRSVIYSLIRECRKVCWERWHFPNLMAGHHLMTKTPGWRSKKQLPV